MTLPLSDDALGGDRSGAARELTVCVTVNSTTVMATYEVKNATVLLTSADFGDTLAALDGRAPEAVAARLLWGMAEVAMVHGDVPYLRDDEVNASGQ